MHSLGNSIRKRLYSVMASPKKSSQLWAGQYWKDVDGFRDVACQSCPKFDASSRDCTIPFGTPLRKCVVAAIEAHLHDAKGKNALELGFGRFSLGKNLINRSGGTWTGVEPHQPKDKPAVIGKGCYGHTKEIPFPDQSFDLVFGIQTLEHWGQKCADTAAMEPSDYRDCLDEILRVLKPGGSIYLDAPIHFHGNEMFIMGDIEKILSYFPETHWTDINIERWRYNYEPLEAYYPDQKLFEEWKEEIFDYTDEEVEKAKKAPIWLFTITATKRAG